ncbi:MAG: hypothetical protein V4638_01220 [Bacteroidota bacterium]
MMRKMYYLLLFFALLGFQVIGQNFIDLRYNVDLYKPFTKNAQEYLLVNDAVSNFSFEANYNRTLFTKNKHNFIAGLSYKYIQLKVIDKIKYIEVTYGGQGQSFSHFEPMRFDLVNQSHSLGLNFRYSYDLTRKKVFGNVNVTSSFYLYEYYKADYVAKDPQPAYPNVTDPDPRFKNIHSILSCINLRLGYTQHIVKEEHFSLSATANVGTNLYSDWELFRKYIWLGVGLEMGFGKGKALFGEKEKAVEN